MHGVFVQTSVKTYKFHFELLREILHYTCLDEL